MLHAQAQSTSSPADTLPRLHDVSLDKQSGYDSFVVERPAGETQTVWIGDPVFTIHPHQVRRLNVKEYPSGDRVLVVHVDRETSRKYTSLTRNFEGQHLAFSIAGEVIRAPRVYEPIQGGRLLLFGVPNDLLSAYTESIQTAPDTQN